jgi:hypothetical protein
MGIIIRIVLYSKRILQLLIQINYYIIIFINLLYLKGNLFKYIINKLAIGI